MHKQIVKEAATVEDAMALIAEELGVAQDQITFEVLRQPQKKTFGLFGGTNAMVQGDADIPEKPESGDPVEYLQRILREMGSDATVRSSETEDGLVLSIEGNDLGFIIGRRGETLDALQYLTGLHANRGGGNYRRITVDVGDYREKREQALRGLAHRMAGDAARTGRRSILEPMNPYERRIIHTAVQEVPGAVSWSVGSDPQRHVVIGPSDDVSARHKSHPRRTTEYYGEESSSSESSRSESYRSAQNKVRPKLPDSDYVIQPPPRQVRQFVPRSHPLPVAEDSSPTEKTRSETENSATLYGRIDL